MYCRWFTTPDPAYGELVVRLYGPETGAMLYRSYVDQLSRQELWTHRLAWRGLALYDAADDNGSVRAHAVVQEARDRPVVYVGFVEAVDDGDVAFHLVGAARHYLEEMFPGRAVYMPVNLSIWHSYRFTTVEREPLPFETPMQPYYGRLFEGLFAQEELYSSYRIPIASTLKGPDPAPGYALREPSPLSVQRDLRAIYDLSVRVFESEHSVPSFGEFKAIHGGAAGSIDPRYVLIAEDGETPAGFIYTVKEGNSLYVKTLAVLPEHQRQGVARLLYETVCTRAMEEGCTTVYGLTMRDDRLISRLLPSDAEKVATYVLYKET